MFCPKDWIMIQQESSEEVTAGGIIIPEKYRGKNAPARGLVVEAGSSCAHVRKDDLVMFSKEHAFTDTIPTEHGMFIQHVFCKEDDIILVINRDSPAK